MSDFGPFIREKRVSVDMDAAQVAEKVGVHPTFIRAIERGAQTPSLVTAEAILAALGVAYKKLKKGNVLTVGRRRFEFAVAIRGQNSQASVLHNCVCPTCGAGHRRKMK